MIIFNSFIAVSDFNFGMQIMEFGRHIFLQTK